MMFYVGTDDYLVPNSVEWMLDDLDDDEAFAALTDVERAAALAWVLDGLVKGDGFEGWIESVGHRSAETVTGLNALGARQFAVLVTQVRELFPTADERDSDARLAVMSTWSAEEMQRLTQLTDAYLAYSRDTDLIERYVVAFVKDHPQEFPQSVADL